MVHLLEDAFVLDNGKGELSDLLLLFAFLHQTGHATTGCQRWAHLRRLLLKLGLQLLQLLDV